MKLSDFFILFEAQDFLNKLNNQYFNRGGEWSTPEGAQIEDTIAKLETLLDKIRDEVEKGNIEDDREPATVDDLVEMLNQTTEYEWKKGGDQ